MMSFFRTILTKLSRNSLPADAGTNSKETAPILMLNTDCCDEIFKYLTLKDLNSFAQTCRALQRVTGLYAKQFPALQSNYISSDKIYTFDADDVLTETLGFIQYINRIEIREKNKSIKYLKNHIHQMHSLTAIHFVSVVINKYVIAVIWKHLPKIEILEITHGRIDVDFYGDFLKLCTNLRELHISANPNGVITRKTNNWLLHTYPLLQVLSLYRDEDEILKINELATFLARNTTIHTFKTTPWCLWSNRYDLLQSNVQLNTLNLYNWHLFESMDVDVWSGILNQLYDCGFYKRLEIEYFNIDQYSVDQFVTVRGFEALSVTQMEDNCNLSVLTGLKMLSLDNCDTDYLMEIAKKLINLEDLQLDHVNYEEILAFIQHARQLKKLNIGSYEGHLDSAELNNERKKLTQPEKVIIFANNPSIMNSNGRTKFEFVELRGK